MIQLSTTGYMKIGVIPFLLGILYLTLSAKPPTQDALTSESKAATHGNPHHEAGKTSKGTGNSKRIPWPEFELSDLKKCDPFDRHMIFPALATQSAESESKPINRQSLVATHSQPFPSKLEPIKVQAVFESPRGIAALVGDRVLHVGDQLSDGSQVMSITPEQLIVSSPGVD